MMAVDEMSQDLNAAFYLGATRRHNVFPNIEIVCGLGRVVHCHCDSDNYRKWQSLNIFNI